MANPPPDTLPEEEYHLSPRKHKAPQERRPLLPLWSLVLTFLVVLLVAGSFIGTVILLGGRSAPANNGQPVIVVISPAPSETPGINELFDITPTPNPLLSEATQSPAESIALSGPTLVPTPTITPTMIAIAPGATVIIISPGGINVRTAPGMDAGREFVANHSETFTVIDGPQQADDLTWWQIRDPRNNRTGWAAENDGLSDLMEVFVP